MVKATALSGRNKKVPRGWRLGRMADHTKTRLSSYKEPCKTQSETKGKIHKKWTAHTNSTSDLRRISTRTLPCLSQAPLTAACRYGLCSIWAGSNI